MGLKELKIGLEESQGLENFTQIGKSLTEELKNFQPVLKSLSKSQTCLENPQKVCSKFERIHVLDSNVSDML